MAERIELPVRGEDGFRITSVRLRNDQIEAIDEIARQSKRSRNDVISFMLDHCIKNTVVTGKEKG